MKTTTLIIATFLILHVNFLFASIDGVPVPSNREVNFSTVLLLAPVTPKEATFEDLIPAAGISVLAPVTPKEASFEDEAEDLNIAGLAPVIPAEADFNDSEFTPDTDMISLRPVTPAEADFTELP